MAVTSPHLCGMGGDLFALVHRPGEEIVRMTQHELELMRRAGAISCEAHRAAMTLQGPVLHRILHEREQHHRRDLHVRDGVGHLSLEGEEAGVADRVEREERRLQREHEETPHHRHVRRGKTTKDRAVTQRFENELRTQPNHSVFVTGIYKREPDDTNHVGVRVEITVSRTYVETAPWLPAQMCITISATHPSLRVPDADGVMRPAISQTANLSSRVIRRLRKIGELVTFTFVDNGVNKEEYHLPLILTRSPELLWFLRVHGIISPRRVNRTKGRLSANERRHNEAEHALPTSELHPCRLRRENRSGHRGHEYGVTVKNNNRLFRQARAQQGQRVAAQGQARGGVVEDDFFALGRLGQLQRRFVDRGMAQQRGGAVLGRGVPHLLAAVA